MHPMHPTSPAQFEASRSGTVPAPRQVRDDVWAVAQRMPGGHLPYSLLYVLRDSDRAFHVVDPGLDSEANWDASPTDVRSITSTHLHPDHIGLADRLHRASGAPLQLHETEAAAIGSPFVTPLAAGAVERLVETWGVPIERHSEIVMVADQASRFIAPRADRTLVDGERLDIPGFDLRALLTPGHTSGHRCPREGARRLLFTGDHLLPMTHAGLGLRAPTASNPLADYLWGLQRVSAFPDHEVLPGHGYRFRGVAVRAAATAEHHLRRSREVVAVLADAPDSSNWEIAAKLTWTAGSQNLTGFVLYSALAQTAMHRNYLERTAERR